MQRQAVAARVRPRPKTDHRPLRVVEAPPATVGEAVERWLRRLAAEGSASLVDYTSFANFHVLRWASELPAVETLTELEVRAYLQAREQDGYMPETLWSLAYSWSALLATVGVKLRPSSLGLPRRVAVSRYAGHELTALEAATLVRSRIGDIGTRALVATALLTGGRASEVRGLRWRDLDTSGEVWVLRWEEQDHAKTGARRPTKDGAAREVPVHPELRLVLQEVREVVYRGRPAPDAPLCPYLPPTGAQRRPSVRDRRKWADSTATSAFRRHLRAHGLRGRPLAVARHTLPGLLRASGADPLAVHALTHPGSLPRVASPGSAHGRYLHVPLEARIRAVLALHLPPCGLPQLPTRSDRQLALDLETSND